MLSEGICVECHNHEL